MDVNGLHEAARNGNLRSIIENGADLSLVSDIFDSCIQSKIIDYRVLTPKTDSGDNDQMRVLRALVNTDHICNMKELLAHPLVESFLVLKWNTFIQIYRGMFILYLIFANSTFKFILEVQQCTNSSLVIANNDTNSRVTSRDCFWNMALLSVFFYLCLGIIVTLDIMALTTYKMVRSWKNIHKNINELCFLMKTACTFLIYILVAIAPVIVAYGGLNKEQNLQVIMCTIVISWTHVLILVSNFPILGYHMHIFWKLAKKTIMILGFSSVLILMFTICFAIQFHAQEPFAQPLKAVMKTLAMMTSEFEYISCIDNATKDSTSSNTIHFLFVFLVLVSITLMTFISTFAVNDVQSFVYKSKLNYLEKQVEFLSALEAFRRNKTLNYFYKLCDYKNVPHTLNISNNKYENYFGAGLGQALQKKVEEQIKKVDEQIEKENKKKESENYLSKLDDILRVVKRNESKLDELQVLIEIY